MEWIVIKSIYLNGRYAVTVRSAGLKMLIEARSNHKIRRGDILTPINNEKYKINNKDKKILSVISATRYSSVHWSILVKLS
ncbi:TPA: polymyxin B resistance protein pmrD [Enterobacter asburiae]|nr:polymyxin B resistance protein pmrD [Enterobacter asburiae]